MGVICSKATSHASPKSSVPPDGALDPYMHSLERRSIEYAMGETPSKRGQAHLLHKHQRSNRTSDARPAAASFTGAQSSPKQPQPLTQPPTALRLPTRLLVRRRPQSSCEEGMSGTHIYAIRYPADQPLKREMAPAQPRSEQAPPRPVPRSEARPWAVSQPQAVPLHPYGPAGVAPPQRPAKPLPVLPPVNDDMKEAPFPPLDHLFARETMFRPPRSKIKDWVTVSEEHKIYVADVGLSAGQCDSLVQISEAVCRGQYAAYTYAKQTLGCREFPALAHACQEAIHTAVYAIIEFSGNRRLVLDDREPHVVKYDDTRRERQKLDMHTDKSEWTFLISLSDGSGHDYDGGGTYFECLDATLHIQRGHALVFPGKLRHCGQRITKGLRFLLVGFLVDKGAATPQQPSPTGLPPDPAAVCLRA